MFLSSAHLEKRLGSHLCGEKDKKMQDALSVFTQKSLITYAKVGWENQKFSGLFRFGGGGAFLERRTKFRVRPIQAHFLPAAGSHTFASSTCMLN